MSEENAWLATEVMGWAHDIEGYHMPKYPGVRYCSTLGWNPRENIEQAFMLLNVLRGEHDGLLISVWSNEDSYHCRLQYYDKQMVLKLLGHGSNCISDAAAIVNAVLSASGYQPIKQGD